MIEEATKPKELESKEIKQANWFKDPLLEDKFLVFLEEASAIGEGKGASQLAITR